jgi:hypothetical protein
MQSPQELAESGAPAPGRPDLPEETFVVDWVLVDPSPAGGDEDLPTDTPGA